MRSCSSRKKRRRPAGRSVRWSLGPPQRSKAFLQRHGNRDPMARRSPDTSGLSPEEADVPPIRVTRERLDRIREHLPERPDVTEARLAREYAIHEQQTHQLVQEGVDELFELIAREIGEQR